VRSPETKKRREIPEQRIISDDLWNAVRGRMAAVNEMYSLELRRPGILRARAVSSPHIFSGLLKCFLCGNKLLIRRRALESQLLARMQAKVLHPDVVSYALKSFEAQLAQAFDRRRDESAAHRRRESEIERKIGNLPRALADGYSPVIRVDLASLEEQLANIRRTCMAAEPAVLGRSMRETRGFVESRLKDLRTLFAAEAVTIRAEIAKHVREITLTPEGRTYPASGTWDLLGAWQHGWCRGPGSCRSRFRVLLANSGLTA
jgi:hypothetical protein